MVKYKNYINDMSNIKNNLLKLEELKNTISSKIIKPINKVQNELVSIEEEVFIEQ